MSSVLRRIGASASPLHRAAPTVSFSNGALYFVEVSPPTLGSWELAVFLGAEQIGDAVRVTAFCPAGQVSMPDSDRCGCAAGTAAG